MATGWLVRTEIVLLFQGQDIEKEVYYRVPHRVTRNTQYYRYARLYLVLRELSANY